MKTPALAVKLRLIWDWALPRRGRDL